MQHKQKYFLCIPNVYMQTITGPYKEGTIGSPMTLKCPPQAEKVLT